MPFHKLHVAVAFVVGTGLQFLVHAVYLGFHLVQVGKGLCRFLKDGTSVFRHQMLGQIGDDTIFRCGDFAAGGLPHSGEYFK